MKTITFIISFLTYSLVWGQNSFSDYKEVLDKDVFEIDTINLNDSCNIINLCFETKLKSPLRTRGRIKGFIPYIMKDTLIIKDTLINDILIKDTLIKHIIVKNTPIRDTSINKKYSTIEYLNKNSCNWSIYNENLQTISILTDPPYKELKINVDFYKSNTFKEYNGDETVEIFGRLVNYPNYYLSGNSIKVQVLQTFVIDKIKKIK